VTDSFVVRPDPAHVRRMMRVQYVVLVLITVLGGARALTTSGWGLVANVALYGAWFGSIVWSLVLWRRVRDTDRLAEVGPQGIGVDGFRRRGWVALPWDAVASVRKDLWGRVVVTPLEGKRLLISVQASDAGANQVLAAVRHFSSGRL
jgi:hypothetical protein